MSQIWGPDGRELGHGHLMPVWGMGENVEWRAVGFVHGVCYLYELGLFTLVVQPDGDVIIRYFMEYHCVCV